jgi:hypothetical protein
MQAFTFTAAVKLIHGTQQVTVFKDKYPGASDINVSSREFPNYDECLASCKSFMDDMKAHIATAAAEKQTFKLSSEVNPVYNNGQATLSKDWDAGEVSRLWIFDEAMEKVGQIHAVAQARVFSTERPKTIRLVN